MSTTQEWSTWKLEECCDILDNRRIPVNSEDREKRIGDIPYYGANGLQGYIDDFIFDEPLILIAEDGGRFDEFATKPIAYRIEGKSWVNNHAHVLKSKTGFSQDAIFYALEHKDIQPFIVGGTRAKLNQSALRSITIQLPKKKSEQSKIAEVLSKVDLTIEQTESLIARQQRIKTGLMQDLLTRGIDEHGNLRSEETHEFKDSPLGRIPAEWEVKELGTALRQARGFLQTGPFGSQLHAYEYANEGVPVIMPQDILFGKISECKIARILESKALELSCHRVQPNDIVFSRRGDLTLAAAIGERERGWVCGTGCFLLRVPNHVMCSKWLADVYRHHYVQLQVDTNAVGSTMASLNNGVMEKLIIAFPNISEQYDIVRNNDAIDAKFRTLIELLDKLRSLKTALMQDLLTGKVRVTPLMENMENSTP